MTSPEKLRSMLEEARQEVGVADSKASILLATLGIGFGALLAGLISSSWTPDKLNGVGCICWWIGAFLALTSVSAAGSSIWPRYRRSAEAFHFFYWGNVAPYRSLETFKQALDRDVVTQDERVEHQLWNLSRLVDRKYWSVRAAIILAGLAVIFMLGAGLTTL